MLQTAARQYCIDQHALWTSRYAAFLFGGGVSYTKAACGVFPRYRLASEVLINIERVVFSETTPLEEARVILLKAGADAFHALKKELEQLKEQRAAVLALEDQLFVYREFIASFDPLTVQIFDLPYRRVLRDEEAAGLWQVLQGRWRIGEADFGWFPLSKDARPVGSLTFHTDLWKARQGDTLFQRFLLSTGVSRCFLLREFEPPGYELDRELADLAFDGSEIFVFTNGDWVIYVSHESSLTLAGSVATFFREQWSDADTLAYGGPFHTSDLRGRWLS